jgi:hypothetical protein
MAKTYTDFRSSKIEANLGTVIAAWADRNAADWILDGLADPARAAYFSSEHVPVAILEQASKLDAVKFLQDALAHGARALQAVGEAHTRIDTQAIADLGAVIVSAKRIAFSEITRLTVQHNETIASVMAATNAARQQNPSLFRDADSDGFDNRTIAPVDCPGCSGAGIRSDYPGVFRCQQCGGFFTNPNEPITMDAALKVVALKAPMQANAGQAGTFYFDLDIITGANSHRRLHGWADAASKSVVQWG